MGDSAKTVPHNSPKYSKLKIPVTSSAVLNAQYGCEHIQTMFKEFKKLSVSQYTLLQQTINERESVIPQTCRTIGSHAVTSITPTYLCLQCPLILDRRGMDAHWEEKGHAFSVESKTGCLYCQNCQDFVYDGALEDVRVLKGRNKRRHSETNSVEDYKLVMYNSSFIPCRAVGLRGLYNMGQTCYMSVVLQSLIHTPFIKYFYLAEGHRQGECEKDSCTSCALDEIIAEFYSTEKSKGYGAVSMLVGSWKGAQSLAGYQQQDAHEYMQFIINSLHLENGGTVGLEVERCNCIIHQTFYGQLQSTVTCVKCKTPTTTLDPVVDLSLDLRTQAKRKKSEAQGGPPETPLLLQDALESFTRKENLSSAEYSCQKCGDTHQNATKQLSIRQLPPILLIHLKRFEHTKSNASKLETKVKFPMSLDMSPYTTKHKEKGKSSNVVHACVYELYSVVVHKGKMDSGHYISYSKDKNDWFMFDDSKVVLVSEADVLQANAYLLFYVVRNLEG